MRESSHFCVPNCIILRLRVLLALLRMASNTGRPELCAIQYVGNSVGR